MTKFITPALLCVLLPSCGALVSDSAESPTLTVVAQPKAAQDNVVTDAKKKAASTALSIAEKRLEQTRLQSESDLAAKERELTFATTELEFAKAKLEQFKAIEMPNRMASAQLDLQRQRDGAKERADELAQIEAMYSEQKIDDKTKEFVLERGRRQAEASAKQVEIAERAHELATKHEIPRELARLELDVVKKSSELEKAKVGLRVNRLEVEIKLLNAESELTKAKNEADQAGVAK